MENYNETFAREYLEESTLISAFSIIWAKNEWKSHNILQDINDRVFI